MGWMYCGEMEGRQIGYGIHATCDKRNCDAIINRGLGCVCGDMHHTLFDEDRGCGGYYCDNHLGWITRGGLCSHRTKNSRMPKRWGKTICQLMTREGLRSAYPRRLFCACMEWEVEIGSPLSTTTVASHTSYEAIDREEEVLVGWRQNEEFMAHVIARNVHPEVLLDEPLEIA